MHASAITLAALAVGAVTAQSTTTPDGAGAQTTITALLGTASGVAASVVAADGCAMTLALACTDTSVCQSAPVVTVTQGPSSYVAAFANVLAGVTGSFSESCALAGTTSALCHQYLSLSAPGTSTVESTVVSLRASELNWQPLAITANAAALSRTTARCTATSKSKGAAAAVPTAGVRAVAEVYKVIVPVGAALLALA